METPITLKFKYENDIRRVKVERDISFEKLHEKAKKLFSLDSFVLKYLDSDEDFITLTSDEELVEAFESSFDKNILRLVVEASPEPRHEVDFFAKYESLEKRLAYLETRKGLQVLRYSRTIRSGLQVNVEPEAKPVSYLTEIADVPKNTKALIIAIVSSPQNHKSELYYNLLLYQEGEQASTKKAWFNEQRFDGHGNVYRHEILVPWSDNGLPMLNITFTYGKCNGTYSDRGNLNKLSIELAGFITCD